MRAAVEVVALDSEVAAAFERAAVRYEDERLTGSILEEDARSRVRDVIERDLDGHELRDL